MEESCKIGTKSNTPGIIFCPYILAQTSPIFIDSFDEVKKRVIAINRDRKIDSILFDKTYEEYKLEDTEEYRKFQDIYLKPVKTIKSRYTVVKINGKYE
jgi:hypothetical protein